MDKGAAKAERGTPAPRGVSVGRKYLTYFPLSMVAASRSSTAVKCIRVA